MVKTQGILKDLQSHQSKSSHLDCQIIEEKKGSISIALKPKVKSGPCDGIKRISDKNTQQNQENLLKS